MGTCVSTAPIDYGELTPGNTTKHTPTPEIKNGVSCNKTASEPEVEEPNCSSSTIGKYRTFSDTHSQSHQIDTEYKYNAPNLSSDQTVEIDENIIIEDFIKIYDHKKEQYQHYGLLLNHKQCKLYLINPHYFEIWKKFEKLTKMNDIISNKRHNGKSQGKNLIFSQKDAEEMVNNLVSNKANDTKHSFGEAINFIMRKNKYLIAKDIMLTNKWGATATATLSFILKIDEELIPTFVNHIIIKYYDDKHTHLIFKFLRLHGLVIKYHNVEKYKNETDNTLHIIFMNDLLLKTIQMLNDRIINYLLIETKLNKDRISKHITIQPYFDQVINDEKQSPDIKVIDLQSTFVSVESINDFDNTEFDGFLYGFTIKREDNQHFTCLLDSNNRRFAWISHIQFILNNKEFIGRRYCSKLTGKRLTMLHLDTDLFIVNHKCNNTDNCTYIEYLIAINKLYINHSMADVVEIILHRKISLVSIHDSYIHCIINPDHNQLLFDKFIDTKCNLSNCIHFKRFDADKNCTENRQRYYKMPNCDIIHILDQIHCYLYHTEYRENNDDQNINNYNRRRQNSLKFIRNLSFSPRYKTKLLLEGDDNDNNDDDEKNEKKEENGKNVQYFSGRLIDYWSAAKRDYNEFESSEDLIADNFEDLCDGIVVFPKYDSLKQEVTQNIVCKLNEEDYNDIYQRSLILLNTTHCMKNMVALHDNKLNEKMCVAAGEYITINHVMSIIIYCNYFNVCREWLEFQRNNQQNNTFDDGEFAHFYRYLCEICQLFGQNMRNDEYLYIIPTNNILFKQWKQMIYFPMSVSPPLDITQSFTKELLHNNNNNNNNNNNYNILKLGTTDNDKCDTQFTHTHTRYFDVRWLSDSYNENERFIIMSPVRIYDILLGEKTSCLKDIYAMQLFQRLMNSQFFSCISSLNQIETQKKLSILIQNHMYNNLKQKCLEKNPLYVYIQNIFDNLIDDLVINKKNNGSIIWFNKSELNKLKCKELAVSIYNINKNKIGTLLNHYDFPDKRIKFVQEYEFQIDENVLNVLIKNNKNKRINSEDEYFIYNSDDKISLYFEFSKKLVIANNNNNNNNNNDEVIQDFECYLCVNLILLPSKFDKVLIECNVYCEDLNQETQFEAVWASENSAMYNNAIGGLVISKNMTKHLDGLPSLTFIITLKVLQTNAVRSPTKSILSNFK